MEATKRKNESNESTHFQSHGFRRVARESRSIGERVYNKNLFRKANQERIVDFCFRQGNILQSLNRYEPTTVSLPFFPYDVDMVSVKELEKIFHEKIFKLFSDKWKLETKYLSITQKIVEHSAYQKIIEMGEYSVPHILNEIQKGEVDYNWNFALRAITKADPVKKGSDSYEEINNDWLAWGKNEGII